MLYRTDLASALLPNNEFKYLTVEFGLRLQVYDKQNYIIDRNYIIKQEIF